MNATELLPFAEDDAADPAEAPAIGALVGWYGGKRTMAPTIVEEVGPHAAWWEVCCGSLAVTLAKPPCRQEVVVDLHGDATNLARVVQHDMLGPRLFEALQFVLFNEDAFRRSLRELAEGPRPAEPETPDFCRAYHYFIVSWQALGGTAGTGRASTTWARRYTSNGGDPATRFRAAVACIPAWWRRLQGVQVWTRDLFDVLPRIEDKAGTAIYVDPPYLAKSHRYLHDFDDAGHGRLAGMLARFRRTKVVLSYYADPRLAGLYPGWAVRAVGVTQFAANAGKAGGAGAIKAPEVLLSNRPLLEIIRTEEGR